MLPSRLLSTAAAAALFTIAALPAAAQDDKGQQGAAELPRAEIEAIVHEYLLAHPEVIIEALELYDARQAQYEAEMRAQAVAALGDEIFARPGSPVIGNPEGDVTLVEFFDYQCGYCKRMEPARAQLLAEDDGLRMVMKEFPILGPASVVAARAALAAEMQGRYEDFHAALMNIQGQLSEQMIFDTAAAVGLDVERLREDMQSPEVAAELRANMDLAQALGINGTPAFVINGQVVPGAVGYDRLKAEIEAEREG